MPRPQRKLYAGAFYYITNQAETRKSIFKDPADYETFFSLLSEASQQFGIKIHGYLLAKNEFHLIIETPQPNLPQALRFINGVYTQSYNRKYKKSGPLFKGRYKSVLLGETSYIAEVLKYIHQSPALKKKSFRADEYQYSSYQGYLKKSSRPTWLQTEKILSFLAENAKTPRSAWVKFCSEDISDQITHKLNPKKWPSILGSQKFLTRIKKRKLADPFGKKKRKQAA